MGPTSSGKTTIASGLTGLLKDKYQLPIIHFDGDEIRDFFGDDFGFKAENRLLVVKAIVHLANKSFDAGLNVVVSALTANSGTRSYVKQNCRNLVTGFVKCSIATCAERDPKGLYAEAKEGKIKTLIGFNSKYEPPKSPDIIVDTEKNDIDCCYGIIVDKLSKMKLLPG